MIRALVLDFDGLIIDSEIAVAQAWREIFSAHDQEFPEQVWRTMVGTRENDGVLWDELARTTGAMPDVERLEAQRKERGLELAQELPALPGVTELLAQAHALDLALAVASSSSGWWVEGHLQRLGLREMFGVVKTRGDAQRSKPFPDIYLAAVGSLGVAACEAIAFEDSAPGVSAARAAGLHTVAIPGSFTEHMTFEHADTVVETLAGFDLPAHIAGIGDGGCAISRS